MSRKVLLLSSGMAAILIVAGVTFWRGNLTFLDSTISEEAVGLRQKLPYVSLQDRLQFEFRHSAAARNAESLMLGDATRGRLEHLEKLLGSKDADARRLALQRLHSREVDRFIQRPGNGLSRWGRLPTPGLLEYEEAPSVFIEEALAHSVGEPPGDTAPAPEFSRHSHERREFTSPSEELRQFHLAGQFSFTDPWSLGDVRDRDHVAGFVSHGFRHLPAIGDPYNAYPTARSSFDSQVTKHETLWSVVRLELVSLLKFDEPAVYVSDRLPQMNELSSATTRPLTPFEQEGLEALRAGEDLVTARSAGDIEMLGALRAAKQCLQCHSVRRGELLGAFSYHLRRKAASPPARVTSEPAT